MQSRIRSACILNGFLASKSSKYWLSKFQVHHSLLLSMGSKGDSFITSCLCDRLTFLSIIGTPDEGPFRVRLRPSPSLLFHGSCILEIQKDFDRNIFNIALFADEIPPRLIVKWQIDHIRQYGSNEIAFKFQSGR